MEAEAGPPQSWAVLTSPSRSDPYQGKKPSLPQAEARPCGVQSATAASASSSWGLGGSRDARASRRLTKASGCGGTSAAEAEARLYLPPNLRGPPVTKTGASPHPEPPALSRAVSDPAVKMLTRLEKAQA